MSKHFFSRKNARKVFQERTLQMDFLVFRRHNLFPISVSQHLKRGHGDPAAPGKTRSAKKAEPKWWPETKSMGMSQK